MSEQTIRQQIFTTLQTVPNIGKVYDYERWSVDWNKFISLFKDNASGRILGWEIGRSAGQGQFLNQIEEERTHHYSIRGYMGVQDADATEKLFNALIESISTTFRGSLDLNGACMQASALSAAVIDTRSFGSVLCHYCELQLTATEILTANP
jgi:hypothetical protein